MAWITKPVAVCEFQTDDLQWDPACVWPEEDDQAGLVVVDRVQGRLTMLDDEARPLVGDPVSRR
jgi:hypothetical protein